MNEHDRAVEAVTWRGGRCHLLDQRRLPAAEEWLELDDPAAVAGAIRDMVVRGAPAIGIAAAYGAALAVRARHGAGPDWVTAFDADLETLRNARPTAANLAWALARVRAASVDAPDPPAAALDEARRIHAEDVAMNHRMGELGAALIEPGSPVVTHCNAGALATGGYGTALGVIRSAWAAGRIAAVFAGETRPWLQGSRLTAWELARDGIPVTLVTDSAMGQLFRRQRPAWVVVGADRIAANGDVANKIGTYHLAVAARHHGARFMVVAPTSTVDMGTPDGDAIPIEDRDPFEIWRTTGADAPPAGVSVLNPAFDVTPAELVDVLVTERGVIERPDAAKMARMMAGNDPG